MADSRCRNWSFIGYPEDSLPDNYRDILDEEHVQWIESPVHDKDINPDESIKKTHIHFLLMFEGNKSYDQICEICDKVNGSRPVKVGSVRGMVRYFIHIDNPEKYQYERSGIIPHGGAEIEQYFEYSQAMKRQFISLMEEWCEDNDCYEIADLRRYARQFHYQDWYDVLINSGGTFLMNAYLTSRRNSRKEKSDESE